MLRPGDVVKLSGTSQLPTIGLVSTTGVNPTTVGHMSVDDYGVVVGIINVMNQQWVTIEDTHGHHDVLVLTSTGVLGWIYPHHLLVA